jgi:hypothetical protein
MWHSPVLLVHICAGIVGLFAGATAIVLRKGSPRHSLAGDIFVVAMIALGATGAFMAVLKFQPGNIVGGIITIYLVSTSWRTMARRDAKPDLLDWSALLVALAIAAVEGTWAIQAATSPTGTKYDLPPWPFIMMGTVASLAAIGDIRFLLRGGIAGSQRLARHLWRMCFALFIASASIFLARAHLFPAFMRKSGMLYLLTLAPILLMIFWLIRVKFSGVYRKKPVEGVRQVSPVHG